MTENQVNINPELVVFSDLDGTLLDAQNYSYRPAQAALDTLKARNIPLILCSSKTQTEMLKIRHELNNTDPFCIENGAALLVPQPYYQQLPESCAIRNTLEADATKNYYRFSLGKSRSEILEVLHSLRINNNYQFTGFSDLSAAALAGLTNLPLGDAEQAKQREFSEPLHWHDSSEKLNEFIVDLKQHDIQLIAGGRFFHAQGLCDKADCVEWMKHYYLQLANINTPEPLAEPITRHASPKLIALGDSPNDLSMLEKADYPVVINTAHGHRIETQARQTYFTREQGPKGWQEAIDFILSSLNLN
jgi:mannosyl-3-phosphoglycerate phosphatase